jgi:hypothetical protein
MDEELEESPNRQQMQFEEYLSRVVSNNVTREIKQFLMGVDKIKKIRLLQTRVSDLDNKNNALTKENNLLTEKCSRLINMLNKQQQAFGTNPTPLPSPLMYIPKITIDVPDFTANSVDAFDYLLKQDSPISRMVLVINKLRRFVGFGDFLKRHRFSEVEIYGVNEGAELKLSHFEGVDVLKISKDAIRNLGEFFDVESTDTLVCMFAVNFTEEMKKEVLYPGQFLVVGDKMLDSEKRKVKLMFPNVTFVTLDEFPCF